MLSWAAATLLTGWVIMAFLFIRYVWFLGISSLAGGGLFVLFLFMGSLPLLTGYKFENLLHGFYPYYRYALYFIFVGSVILLVLTLAVDAGWFIGHRLGWFDCLPYSREYCIRFNKFILAAAFLCTCYALYAGTKIPEVKKISLTSEKIEKPRTIAVLSDLHIHRIINPQKIAGIIERTNAQNPDIILLAGDIIDDRISRVSEIVALLKNLKARDGIYFVTGNHEFYAGYQTAVAELKKLGFRFLENEGINLQDIWLAGIPDATAGGRYGKKIDLSQTFAGAHPGQFRLLMSHTPVDFESKNNFDLEISGHTHGGQIFPFHIPVLLRNHYLAGLYDMKNGARLYVSRGAGQWGPQMRFLAPSEITVLRLIPAEQKNKKE